MDWRLYLDANIAIEKIEDLISKKWYSQAREYLNTETVKDTLIKAYGWRCWDAYELKLSQRLNG